jgi:hypothetical protein
MKFLIIPISFILFNCTVPEAIETNPVVETKPATGVNYSAATLNGVLVDEGCMCSAINRGFVYSESKKDLLNGTLVNVGNGNKGPISFKLENLKKDTKYYFNTYAINSTGKIYGVIDSFITKPKVIDSLIIKPGASWEYKLVTPETGWTTAYGTWPKGNAPFGNLKTTNPSDSSFLFSYATLWPAKRVLYVRNKVDLTEYDLKSIRFSIAVDNGYELIVNGKLVSKKYANFYTYRWEYSEIIPSSFLKDGENIIAIILTDDGGYTAFDMQLTGKAR